MSKELSSSDGSFRLPKEIRPLKYDLFLHPNLENNTFNGRVSILIDITGKQKLIKLHQKELAITSVKLTKRINDDSSDVEIEDSYTHDKDEAFIIKLKQELDSGLYDLNLLFSGSLRDKIVGFYSSKYKDGEKTR